MDKCTKIWEDCNHSQGMNVVALRKCITYNATKRNETLNQANDFVHHCQDDSVKQLRRQNFQLHCVNGVEVKTVKTLNNLR